MNIFQRVGVWFMSFFKADIENTFNIKTISSETMREYQMLWENLVKGSPDWLDENTSTINFAKFVSQYTAKKTCLDLKVTVEGSERADFINNIINNMVDKSIRDKVEDCCSYGGIILKPNGNINPCNAIDYLSPSDFIITEKTSNGDIMGCVFINRITKGDEHYTRLEYHHFIEVDGIRYYKVENRAYLSLSEKSLGMEIPLTDVLEWEKLNPSVVIGNIEKPLFAYLKTPYNNVLDRTSPEGVAVFYNCVEELKALDIAFSRMSSETEDSQHITFLDQNAMTKQGKEGRESRVKLPRFVKGIGMGSTIDKSNLIDEHVATMLTSQRINGINTILSLISTKCGFSSGQFILNQKSGRLTATEVESDDNETVETITELRKSLMVAIKDLVYALDKYCDIVYKLPKGYVNALDKDVANEDIFYFQDLISSFQQDRQRAYQLVLSNIYSKKKYLQEYEGFSSKEAEAMLEEIKSEQASENKGLFEEEGM